MSAARIGLGVAALAALAWQLGALQPYQPRAWTAIDLHWQFVPIYEGYFGSIRRGAPMLWNPYQLCGMPAVGTLEGGFFYPPHLLYLLLPTAWALALSTLQHVALAAGGTAAFARRSGISPVGALFAAAVFTFAGPLRGMQLWPVMLEAIAWLPVGGIAILDLTGAARRRGAILLACASGMSWLAGYPQATVLACYAWGALFGARLLVARPGVAAAASALGALLVGLSAGVLLAAVALLPGLELAREAVRGTSSLDVPSMYPFGVPSVDALWRGLLGTDARVLTVVALALAPLAVRRGPGWLTIWGLMLVVVAAAFALGPATPLFPLLTLLPMLGWFRVPHRALVVGQFALAILGGAGLDAATRRPPLTRLVPIVVIVLLAVATLEGIRRPEPIPPPPYRSNRISHSPAHHEAYSRLAADLAELRAWPFNPIYTQYALPPKLPTMTRLRSIDDYEPLLLRRPREYFGFLAEGRLPSGGRPASNVVQSLAGIRGEPPPATRRRLLDLASVRYLLLPPPAKRRPEIAAFVRDGGLVPRPDPAKSLDVFENPHVLPRAFVTYRAASAPPTAQLLPLLARESFDPLAESFVEGAGLPAADGAPARGTPATIVRDDAQVVEIDATLAAPGLVVLADTYYPGWTATVDGAPAPILPTNHLFRGVPAPAGTHRIRFAYRPRSLALGAALSLLTALALAAGAYRLKTRPAT
jgi:hypothetical protein